MDKKNDTITGNSLIYYHYNYTSRAGGYIGLACTIATGVRLAADKQAAVEPG